MIYRPIPQTLTLWVAPELWQAALSASPRRNRANGHDIAFYRTLAGLVVMSALGREAEPLDRRAGISTAFKPCAYDQLERRYENRQEHAPGDGAPFAPYSEFELGTTSYVVAAATPLDAFSVQIDCRCRPFAQLDYDYILPCSITVDMRVQVFAPFPARVADAWRTYQGYARCDLEDCLPLASLADLLYEVETEGVET